MGPAYEDNSHVVVSVMQLVDGLTSNDDDCWEIGVHPSPPVAPWSTNFLLSAPTPFCATANWENWYISMSDMARRFPGEPRFQLHAEWAAKVLIWRASQEQWRGRDPWVLGNA